MRKALIYKEWKKTRWVSIGLFLIGILLLIYLFLKMGRAFRFAGKEHLWDVIINRNQFLLRGLKYYPIYTGVCLGIAQFIPEMIKKRIKLTLHLPLKERSSVLIMLGYGLLVLLSIFIIQFLCMYIYVHVYFPKEIINSIWLTVLPWYMAGLTAYLFMAMIVLEPTWKRRIFNLLLMVGTVKLFFFSDFPGAYSLIVLALIFIPIYILPFTFLSVHRFKTGEQD